MHARSHVPVAPDAQVGTAGRLFAALGRCAGHRQGFATVDHAGRIGGKQEIAAAVGVQGVQESRVL